MRSKRHLIMASLILAVFLLAPLQGVAYSIVREPESSTPIFSISGPENVLYLTQEDVISISTGQNLRTQRSYWKDVAVRTTLIKENVTLADFPQSIYYSEPNPYAPGEAHGTLYISGFYQVVVPYGFYVYYSGYLYYYD